MSKSTIQGDRILVVTEQENGEASPVTLELFNVGRRLADSGGHILCALVLGHEVATLAEEMASYADEVYPVDHKLLAEFQADLYASALEEACQVLEPLSLLLGHTYDNLEMAPKVAFRLGSDLITDCVRVEETAAADISYAPSRFTAAMPGPFLSWIPIPKWSSSGPRFMSL